MASAVGIVKSATRDLFVASYAVAGRQYPSFSTSHPAGHAARAIAAANKTIRALIILAGVICGDETPLRVGPGPKIHKFCQVTASSVRAVAAVTWGLECHGRNRDRLERMLLDGGAASAASRSGKTDPTG